MKLSSHAIAKEIQKTIDVTFRLSENEGRDKVIPLDEAIRRHIKPRMTLHVEAGAEAAIREILRQFWKAKPGFAIIMSMPGGTCVPCLIHAGLVKKLVFTNCSDMYPTPKPNQVIQRAFQEKTLELENWSMLTLELRLLAGALGIGFMPTRSLIGSSVAEDNRGSFRVIDDPFSSGKRLGLVKASNPDLSLVHGWAADRYGNTITSPVGTAIGCWGAKASKNGALVTTEKLVSSEFIRQHSRSVTIPGCLVSSVSIVPFGAHPQAMVNVGLPEFESYGLDANYITGLRKASEDPRLLDAWIEEWILNLKSHSDYLLKLGQERLLSLKEKARREYDKHELACHLKSIFAQRDYNMAEMMVIAAAREIKELILTKGYKTVFGGMGFSALSSWLAYYLLRKDGHYVDLVAIGIGFTPLPGDPFMLNPANFSTTKMLPDLIDIHGTIVTGENNSCIGVLGAGQIDKYGNINSSKISDKLFLAGVGGGNDIASGAREVVAVLIQSKHRFVEKVPYVSQPGERVRTLVSTTGVFKKPRGKREFYLTQYYPVAKLSTPEEHIREIRANCDWDLKVAKDVKAVLPPTNEELVILRAMDPEGSFIGN